MPEKHYRSDAWVSGHYRNGVWIEPHHRSNTMVTRSMTDSETPFAGWLYEKKKPLTRQIACWICGADTYFFRDQNGGCALFDKLGKPWPLHPCWQDLQNQKRLTSKLEEELTRAGSYGTFRRGASMAIQAPLKNKHRVSVTGYLVDEMPIAAEPMLIKCSSKSNSCPVVEVAVSDGKHIYPFLLPEQQLCKLDSSMLKIEGTWLQRESNWLLLATRFQSLAPKSNSYRHMDALRADNSCVYCGAELEAAARWGLDDKGHGECPKCGKCRNAMTHDDFMAHLRLIVTKYAESKPASKLEKNNQGTKRRKVPEVTKPLPPQPSNPAPTTNVARSTKRTFGKDMDFVCSYCGKTTRQPDSHLGRCGYCLKHSFS